MQVIAVPLESDRDEAGQWAKEFKASFPVVFDPKQKIAEGYGVQAIPFNVAIDRDGKVVKTIVGADTDALDAVVKQLAGGKGS
jgi:peroxiredoxin